MGSPVNMAFGKRIPAPRTAFDERVGSRYRAFGGDVADVSARSARFQAVSQCGERDHGRDLPTATPECVGTLSFGTCDARIGVRQCKRQAANDHADMLTSTEDLRAEMQPEACVNAFNI